MKKFQIGQSIKLPTCVKGSYKRIFYPENEQDQIEIKEFSIIGKNDYYSEYLVLLDSDMLGYNISDFHILHSEVDSKYKGSKFWYVPYHTLANYN